MGRAFSPGCCSDSKALLEAGLGQKQGPKTGGLGFRVWGEGGGHDVMLLRVSREHCRYGCCCTLYLFNSLVCGCWIQGPSLSSCVATLSLLPEQNYASHRHRARNRPKKQSIDIDASGSGVAEYCSPLLVVKIKVAMHICDKHDAR